MVSDDFYFCVDRRTIMSLHSRAKDFCRMEKTMLTPPIMKHTDELSYIYNRKYSLGQQK